MCVGLPDLLTGSGSTQVRLAKLNEHGGREVLGERGGKGRAGLWANLLGEGGGARICHLGWSLTPSPSTVGLDTGCSDCYLFQQSRPESHHSGHCHITWGEGNNSPSPGLHHSQSQPHPG